MNPQSNKEFIRLTGMTHVKTSPFHPQSIGKDKKIFGVIEWLNTLIFLDTLS